MSRRERMVALIDALGGADAVCAALSRSRSTMKDWMARLAFPPAIYGELIEIAAPRRVHVPTDLFGRSAEDHWPANPPVEQDDAA